MDDDEITKTKKLLESVKQLTPQEGLEEVVSKMSDEDWGNMLNRKRALAEAKEAAQSPVREALEKSRSTSFRSGYKDWASGAPTTQEQSKSFYERLAKEAAKDDVVRDIDLNKYQMQKAADAKKLARSQALKRFLGAAGKGLSVAGKIIAPIGWITELYGDDIAPEGEEFEMPRKPRK